MESIKTKRKGLTSLVLLLISVAMLATTTFAWFTDTATVKGNTINAGNLSVDLYADEVILKNLYLNEGVEGQTSEAWDATEGDAKETWIASKGLTEEDKIPASDLSGTGDVYIITNKTLPVIKLENVEPGQTFEVKNVGVINRGQLAISYTAGFAVDESLTGLGNLYSNISNLADTQKKNSLLAKQAAKKADGSLKSTWGNSYIAADDLGGHLEDVMVVYAWDGTEPASELVKYNEEDGTIDTTAPGYIGTISQIIHAGDAAYIATASDEEKAELAAVSARIKAASSGFCLPKSETSDEKYDTKTDITVLKYTYDGSSTSVAHTGDDGVSSMGELQYLIHMPKLAGNEYQNAALKLSIGATASQVEFEADGTGYTFYDRAQ